MEEMNKINEIKQDFDIKLKEYEYYFEKFENEVSYFILRYDYKGSIQKLKTISINILLDKNTNEINIELLKYAGLGVYIRYKTNKDGLFEFLNEVIEKNKEVVV